MIRRFAILIFDRRKLYSTSVMIPVAYPDTRVPELEDDARDTCNYYEIQLDKRKKLWFVKIAQRRVSRFSISRTEIVNFLPTCCGIVSKNFR